LRPWRSGGGRVAEIERQAANLSNAGVLVVPPTGRRRSWPSNISSRARNGMKNNELRDFLMMLQMAELPY
jgi:hypothetical protein